MQPFGLLGPVDEEWLKENKIMGCPQPHITSGKNICYHWTYQYYK